MRIVLHRAADRGVGEHGWLHTRFSFSFADWYDPTRMGFGVLCVINDDIIDPHSGFGKHPHANMEIITIVREGAVSHEDSMGNVYTVPAGDIQVMSAGMGVVHAEQNTGSMPLKLFQIWIKPSTQNVTPRYDQKSFGVIKNSNTFELLVSGERGGAPLTINQDAFISRARLEVGVPLSYTLHDAQNGVYVFVVEGAVSVLGNTLDSRDALGVWGSESLALQAESEAEVLIFEVPER